MKFDNTQKAYQLKTDRDLQKAYYLFLLFSNEKLVSIGSSITRLILRIKLPVSYIFKITFFSQFCAGLNKKESLKVVESLKSYKILSYLHYAVEAVKTENGMEISKNNTLETLSFSKKNKALPFSVFKATSLGTIILFEKIQSYNDTSTHGRSSGTSYGYPDTGKRDPKVQRFIERHTLYSYR